MTKIDSKTAVIIGVSALLVLTSFLGFYQYQQVSSISQEKAILSSENQNLENSLKEVQDKESQNQLFINSLKGVNSNLEGQVDELSLDNSELQSQVSSLEIENNRLSSEKDDLLFKYDTLSGENVQLAHASSAQRQKIQEMISLISQLDEEQQKELLQNLKFLEQTKEVEFYRNLGSHNYKDNQEYSFYWEIPFLSYYQYRSDPDGHAGAYLNSSESVKYFKTSLNTWQDLKPLADLLRKEAGYDDEVFANMALQVTHQFKYIPTDYTKYPLESFVEGSGDCDTLAVFAAALMKAGGLDTIIILGEAKGSPEDDIGGGHAMVGVYLSEQPDDHRESVSYYEHEGRVYYVAEATWADEFAKPWDYDVIGAAVGDNPWTEFKVTDVVETPN